MSNLIWTPDHPLFNTVLHSNIPPGVTFDGFYCVRSESGLLETITESELDDYLYGGELQEVENANSD